MIELSVDISYLSKYYGLSTARMFEYQLAGSKKAGSADNENGENITIQTEDGMITINAEMLKKLLEQPEKLAKILKLTDPENRYLIIQQLNEEDLNKLLPFLSSEQLAFGLQYFTMDGLNELLINLPQEELIKLVLEKFTMEDIAPLMKENEMNRFFSSTDLDKNDIIKYFKSMEWKNLQELMVNQFGEGFRKKTSKESVEYIENMDDRDFKRFILNMQRHEKEDAMAGLCKINPDYYALVDNSILVRPMMANLEKEEIIQTMTKLEPEFLAPMIEELPQNLIQVVAVQIDPTIFSKILSREFPDMLMEMLAG